MNYQKLKQKKDQIVAEIHDGSYRTKKILSAEDFDMLLYFIDEYEELTRQMLQYIKQKETNDEEDRKWLESYLSLGE